MNSTDIGNSGETDTIFQNGLANESSPRVAAILAAHPDRDVLICLAGCGGGPKLVAIRNRPTDGVNAAAGAGQLQPTAAQLLAQPAVAAARLSSEPQIGDVICLAGCLGAPGEVVQKAIRLTWVGQGANEELKSALRAIGDRLLAGETIAVPEAPAGREWISEQARAHLVSPQLPTVLAGLVRSALPLAAGRTTVTQR